MSNVYPVIGSSPSTVTPEVITLNEVFLNASVLTSNLIVFNSSIIEGVTSISSTTTLDAAGNELSVLVTGYGTTPVTITLPTLDAGLPLTQGRVIRIADGDGNAASYNITISRAGSNTIEGQTSLVLNKAYQSVTLQSKGTTWYIMGGSLASGTANAIPVFNSWKTMGDSIMTQPTATNISIAGNALVTNNLTVTGNVTIDTSTFVVDAVNNRVGVGITNPTESLHVVGNVYVHGNISAQGNLSVINTNVTVTDQFEISNSGTGPALIVNQCGSEAIANFRDDTVSMMYLADGGDIGIQTTSPLSKLHINKVLSSGIWDNIDSGLRVGGQYIGSSSTGVHLQIGSNQTTYSWIQSFEDNVADGTTGSFKNVTLQPAGGNVGIGAATPVVPLEVTKSGDGGFVRIATLDGPNITAGVGNSAQFHVGREFLAEYNTSEYNFLYDADGSTTNRLGMGLAALPFGVTMMGTGNVGINSFTPQEKLDVNGNIIISGSIKNPTLYSYRETVVSASTGASYTIDCATSNNFDLTLDASPTISFSNVPSSVTFIVTLYLTQGGTGSYTVTWPGSVSWGTAGTPTLSTTVGNTDIITLTTVNGGTKWVGNLVEKGY